MLFVSDLKLIAQLLGLLQQCLISLHGSLDKSIRALCMRVLFDTEDLLFPGLGVVLKLLDSPGTGVLREDALRGLFFGIGYHLVELRLAPLFLLAH